MYARTMRLGLPLRTSALLIALALTLGLCAVPARADVGGQEDAPEAAIEAAPEVGLSAAAEDDQEDPFVRDGIANMNELPEDLYVDGGAGSVARMNLDFAAIGVPEGVEPTVRVEVGEYLWDNEEMPWGPSVNVDGFAVYDAATRTVSLEGSRLAGEGGRPLYEGVYVNAVVIWGEEGSEILRITGAIFGVVRGNQYGARVRLDPNGHDNRLYSGSTATVALHTEGLAEAEADGNKLAVFVGCWYGHPDFTTAFAEGDGYTYDAASGTVTLDGTQLATRNLDHVDVFALIAPEPAASETFGDAYWESIQAIDVASFDVRTPRENYEREWDDAMLPGWEWEVHRWYGLDLDTPAHPDNEENRPDRYEVVDVAVAEQRRWDDDAQGMVAFPYEEGSEDNVVDVWKDTWTYSDDEGTHDDWNWRYRAQNLGEARLTVTYLDADGAEQSYDFAVRVDGDVYAVDIWSEDGTERALPGETIAVRAQGKHHRANQETQTEGFTYEWALENDEYATIAADPTDPQRALVTFKDMPTDRDHLWEDVVVQARLLEGGEERACRDFHLTVASDYCAVWPAAIDRNLGIGASVTVTPEVRRYDLGGGASYSIVEGASFSWENVDDNALRIEDNGNGSYTITRIGTWDTDFGLRAWWEEDGGHREEWRGYHLDDRDYRISLTWDGDATATESGVDDEGRAWTNPLLYSDGTTTLTLEAGELGSLDGISYDWAVGVADDQGGFPHEATQGVAADGTRVVLDGAALYADQTIREHGGADVRVRAMFGGLKVVDAWCWVPLRESCRDHDWGEKVLVAPTCTKAGSKRLNCGNCGEKRVVVVPATGHSLAGEKVRPATISATGTKAHWRCTACGALFADAKGKTATTKKALTIPQLVDVAKATVTVAKATYTGKALTPAVTVKQGGKTLRKGTDYKVAYTRNVNAPKGTVTITGIGAYGGTKKTTFAIAKAANTMTVQTKAVTAKATSKTTIKRTKAFVVAKANGKVTYKKKFGDARVTITKAGGITVKKGLKKGRTYKVKVAVTAAGNTNHKAITKVVTLKIKVK